ncbi:DUF2975 domain-containing protein [Seonamhaeicola sediminis]|uniref:DUF2975 domain-containing protein n=1 Tax=Seonamhaeicola sediminis TaxID=2528206 RepID=A0A562YG50_9FLAO|nr:DUF2975 domain-containing protein [Seonamhaeicola sediminis]TWO33853.1 DUF2975 domain-containing protein [Seonamhaeicola sediminis]
MKTITILKKIITAYYYLAIFGFLFLTIGFPIIFSIKKNKVSLEEPIELNFMDMNIDVSNMGLGAFIAIIVIGAIILFPFLKGIYLFKKSLHDLSNGNYFSDLVVTNFKKIGVCFLIFGFGQWIFKIAVQLIFVNDLKLGIDNTLFLSSILGLFFLFLSEAFAKAKETKQENDLTI